MVSVIITCYNYGKYLAGCLESVLCQTYRDFEIVIVNDGSTDNTDKVMQKYLPEPKIRYIKQKNSGQANAKNTGIRNAKGDFLAFLDADDLWDSTKLEKQIPYFADPSVGVVYSVAGYIDEDGHSQNFTLGKYLAPRSGNVTSYLYFDNFVPFSSAMVRKECLEKFGSFDESIKMGIDWDLWLRLSVRYKFAYVDEALLLYRVGHSGQMSKNLEERQRCSDRIMIKFVQGHPNMLPESTIQKAMAYTNRNRGYYYRHIDIRRSNRLYLEAIKCNIKEWGAYRGLIKNMFIMCGLVRG